jgi:hypothetical protein
VRSNQISARKSRERGAIEMDLLDLGRDAAHPKSRRKFEKASYDRVTGFIAALLIGLGPITTSPPAFAQGGLAQKSASITPSHQPPYGNTTGAIGDGGPALDGELKELGPTNIGMPFCINDAPITSPYHQLCLGANALGGGLLSYTAHGGAPSLPIPCNINGQTTPCLGVRGPPGSEFTVPNCTPDGTSDNSSCLQTVANSLCAAGGGMLLIPAGRWRFHDITFPCDGIHVLGAGTGGLDVGASPATKSNGTIVDCTEMIDHCIRFRPARFPAQQRLIGDSVEKISFWNNGGTGSVLDFEQIQSGYARDIEFSYPPTALRLFGVLGFYVSNVQPRGVVNTAIEITGDMSGKKQADGTACTLADCSTRTDYVHLDHVYGWSQQAATFISIHDQAFTTVGDHIAQEGGLYGLRVGCAAGQPSLGYCPEQIIFRDFENEYGLHPLDLQDFSWFRCVSCYFAGNTSQHATNPSADTQNVIIASLVNYSQSGGAGGGLTLTDSQVYGAERSCVLIDVTDTSITGSQIFGCNLTGPNTAAIEYHSGEQHIASNNTLCRSIGAGFGSIGILIDSAANTVSASNNMYNGCILPGGTFAGLINHGATFPFTIYESNPNPRAASPTISNATGLGTGGRAVTYNGNDLGGLILLTAGSGAAATGQLQLNFSTQHYPEAICHVIAQNAGGGWQTPTFVNDRSTPNFTQIQWNNAVPLAAGGGYLIQYNCGGF